MKPTNDGPRSQYFQVLPITEGILLEELPAYQCSQNMTEALEHAPVGSCTAWGIPFEINRIVVIKDQVVRLNLPPTQARWMVFLHTSDLRPMEQNEHGFYSPMPGRGQLNELAATYIISYTDGSEETIPIRRRHQIGALTRRWGENCLQAVAHHKPQSMDATSVQPGGDWGWVQTRASASDSFPWVNWLYAWENPHPEKVIVGLRMEPVSGLIVLSGVSAGNITTHPLRWEPRRKACLRLDEGDKFDPKLDENGLLRHLQLDMGQVISARPRPYYPNETWIETHNNLLPGISPNEVLIEYTAHPAACFHLPQGKTIPVMELSDMTLEDPLRLVPPAEKTVRLRVVDKGSSKPTAVKLHVHGAWGEYLAPIDRHRIINPAWFEDYSVDFLHVDYGRTEGEHPTTYINGETILKLPLGDVYIEVSKGYEVRPVRRIVQVTPDTEEILVELEKVLPWREKGWVTADTHVHFLSPISAMIEGAAEGVNIINLLASQWGELMTNVGDFDGKNTWGSKETGGDGEYLVRVGTENRQHILGHISLLGYNGPIIAPMTTGGPDESALGDAVEVLLTEWARQCRAQGGVVILPHFPNPRAEHAAAIVQGLIDGIEMTSWADLYSGIDPYSLSDWYRYLNCGYLLPAVGGSDKMAACMPVGTVRTYAHLPSNTPFTYENWKEAIRRKETFVTNGPLLDFFVNGEPMGSTVHLPHSGGALDVTWQTASVTLPMTRVDLVVNGEIRESSTVSPWGASGNWKIKLDHSSWLALLVRGHHPERPEIIAAHSTPVMALVEGSALMAAADAVSILEQIEGAAAFLDTVATRADQKVYRRMRMELTTAHRTLHNRMHQAGYEHQHTLDDEG